MTHKRFFNKLKLFYNGVKIGNNWYAVKYYCQPTSFSFQIVSNQGSDIGRCFNHFYPEFESEIYYDWETNMLAIIQDIYKTLISFNKTKQDDNKL